MNDGRIICAGRGSRKIKRPAHLSDYVLDEELLEPLRKSPRFETSITSEIFEDADEGNDTESSTAGPSGVSEDIEVDSLSEHPIDDSHRNPSVTRSSETIYSEQQIYPEPSFQTNSTMEEQLRLLTEAINSMKTNMDTLQKKLDDVQEKVDNAPSQVSQTTQEEATVNGVIVQPSISGLSSFSRGHMLIDLPAFNGDFKEWPNFISESDDTTAAEGYTTLQNNS